MTTIDFRSPVLKPLLRAGTPKPVPPDPRAYDTFRVTQQFDSVDAFYKDGRIHRATDIGNFCCGDPVVAMAAGTLRRVKDNATALGAPTDALGVVIDHGSGIVTEYWHLDKYAGPSSGPVKAGAQIGVVGDTGLGSVCHLHVEAKRDGERFDPEPLMFGGSVAVNDGATRDTRDRFLLNVSGWVVNRQADIRSGASIRSTPRYNPEAPTANILRVLTALETHQLLVRRRGTDIDGNGRWWALTDEIVDYGYVHDSDVSNARPIETSDSALQTKIDRALSALNGAEQAHGAEGAALAAARGSLA